MRMENKVAIVTGAASGIGKAIAEKYLVEGATVVFADMAENLELNNEKAIYIKCDVSKSAEVEALVKATVDKFGRLDVMVNNAGVGGLGGILDATDESWDKTISVNLTGVFYGARAAAKAMKNQSIKGSIINMSSILGKVGLASTVCYCASKGGVVQLTHAAALDLATLGIRVNAIAPGFITTGMTQDILKNEAFNNMVVSSTPLGHVGHVDDIASAALYLGSDESTYVTGEVLYVDGGWTAR
ncbi:MAG: SDR family NAD(P)-dependent oxidoreductase [Candidatus Falkowbacteria bacterium]